MAASMMLEEEGYNVEMCHTYQDGFRQAQNGGFGIVVIDVHLGRQSGVELAHELLSNGLKTKFILTSGLEDLTKELASYPDLKQVSVLLKPFTRLDLLDSVRKAMNEAAA